MTLVTTITRFKAKIGFEDQLIDALRKFDNSNSISWQILSLGDSEYAALNTYDSIEDRSMDVVSGLDWLDSITPILELYENGSRTKAFSGIVLHQNEIDNIILVGGSTRLKLIKRKNDMDRHTTKFFIKFRIFLNQLHLI